MGLDYSRLLGYKATDTGQPADLNKVILDRYQRNQCNSALLQSDIVRGAQAGESLHSLLLKACKAISCMTGDPAFFQAVQESIISRTPP